MVGMLRAFSTRACGVGFNGGEHAAHHAARAQMAHQRARIETGNHRNAGAAEKGVRLRIRAPVAGDGRELAHHQTFDIRTGRLVVRGTGSVVADLRIGEDDDLAGIGGIGEDFLIAGEGGIEDDLSGPLGGRTKTLALEDGAVFQGEDCSVQFRLFLRFPAALRGTKPQGAPHSAWQLLEHMRIAQEDILDFSRNPKYREKKFPDDYWPATEAPPSEDAWEKSIQQFQSDLKEMQELVADTKHDLLARIPSRTEQTLLREGVVGGGPQRVSPGAVGVLGEARGQSQET